VPKFKPAYLIHGDDHGRIAERRARLRTVAETDSGSGGVEVLEGEDATPAAVARVLCAMTFAIGRRFVVVDGVERWKDADVVRDLQPVLETMPEDTTVAFFAREEGRYRAPAKLAAAVGAAGGDVIAENALKAKELPRWASQEAARLGIDLDAAAARALVGQVGERQQRLLRELEKLAIEHGPGARLGAEEVEDAASRSAERQVWGLVDALVARDLKGSTRAYLELREQGEALARLVPLVARRLRDTLAIAVWLETGDSAAQIKERLGGSPWVADRRIREARSADAEPLRRALEVLAQLERDTRGDTELADETVAIRAIARITA
jgi:DNA polymerase-3 subunit delta